MKKSLFLLGHLKDLDIDWMINHGSKKNLEIGSKLISKGQPVKNIYIILSGKFSISNDSNEIAQVDTGEVVGEMSFLESRPPSVSVIAKENSVVFSLPRDVMLSKMNENSEFKSNFYYSLALFLSNRLRTTTNNLGYGNQDEEDLLDHNILESVAKAGGRFNEILNKFSEI